MEAFLVLCKSAIPHRQVFSFFCSPTLTEIYICFYFSDSSNIQTVVVTTKTTLGKRPLMKIYSIFFFFLPQHHLFRTEPATKMKCTKKKTLYSICWAQLYSGLQVEKLEDCSSCVSVRSFTGATTNKTFKNEIII